MSKERNSQKSFLFLGIIVLSGAAGLLWYWWQAEKYPSTENAYIGGHISQISSKVSGQIEHVYVESNQIVKAGQPLFSINPDPFDIALAKARAQLDGVADNAGTIANDVNKATDALKKSQDAVDKAQDEYSKRYTQLLEKKSSTEDLAKAEKAFKEAKADFDKKFDELTQVREDLDRKGKINSLLRTAIADAQQAEQARAETLVTAQTDGIVSNVRLRPGMVVQASIPQMGLVEQNVLWVDANFKETDLKNIRIGQPVKVKVDMYPNMKLTGTVESISSSSGSVFSLLPAENATGNWVKVTQRVPVRISLKDMNKEADRPLRIGTSAWVQIDTTVQSSAK